MLLQQLATELGAELEVLRHLGNESFGSLFLANDLALPRQVVIKVLRREFVDKENARRRFEREARAVARVDHPNVVQVHTVDKLANGVPYFIEPWLGDRTLKDRLESVGRFQPAEVRQALSQLASALAAAHRAGIVHRDVHPGAVRCAGEGMQRLLLTDFGLAAILESAGLDEHAITDTGEILGSPGYMSPEQRAERPATDRSDVYSLGVLGWELLTGSTEGLPSAPDGMDRSAMLNAAPDDPGLIDLIGRCLRTEPKERPSAAEVADELERSAVGVSRRGWHRTSLTELFEQWVPVFVITLMATALAFAALLVDFLESSSRTQAFILAFLGTVLLEALVLTVYHGRRGRQVVTRTELWLLLAVALLGCVAMIVVWQAVPAT